MDGTENKYRFPNQGGGGHKWGVRVRFFGGGIGVHPIMTRVRETSTPHGKKGVGGQIRRSPALKSFYISPQSYNHTHIIASLYYIVNVRLYY